MKKLFLFAMMAVLLVACEAKDPNPAARIYTGNIVGTLGCYDASTHTIFYKGYFIETDERDTVLSFNIDVEDSIEVKYGTYVIPSIKIPYSFTLITLDMKDKQYIHYEVPIDDAMHQPFSKPLNEINQVLINPCK